MMNSYVQYFTSIIKHNNQNIFNCIESLRSVRSSPGDYRGLIASMPM
jgi:hypothetical protein